MYIDTAQKQGEKYLMPVTECLDVTDLLVLENTKSQETKSKSYSIRFMYMHISNRYIYIRKIRSSYEFEFHHFTHSIEKKISIINAMNHSVNLGGRKLIKHIGSLK